jgi:hypothetical protein
MHQQELAHHTLYGRLTRGATDSSEMDFEPIARPVRPRSSRSDVELEYFPLTFWRLDGGQVCFEKPFSEDDDAEPEAQIHGLKKTWAFVASAHRSVDEAGRSNDWPTAESATPHTVTLKDKGSRWHKDERVAEICVAAPTLTPRANFLVLTALAKGPEVSNFALIWELHR